MTRHSHQVFDSKGRSRGLVQRVGEALGWSDGLEGVKASMQQSGPEGGSTGGNSSGFTGGLTAGEMSGPGTVVQGGNSPGNVTVVQPGSTTVVQPVVQAASDNMVQGGEPSGELFGVELHVVDGRLLACRPGEPPPLSVRQHTQTFLDWLQAHPKVPGNEVPVATLEHVLYWEFLWAADLPMKPWRAVLDTLVKLGVRKYQADWRDPAGDGPNRSS